MFIEKYIYTYNYDTFFNNYLNFADKLWILKLIKKF